LWKTFKNVWKKQFSSSVDVVLGRNLPIVKSVCATSHSVHKSSKTLANSLATCYNNSMDLQKTQRVNFLSFWVFWDSHFFIKLKKTKS